MTYFASRVLFRENVGRADGRIIDGEAIPATLPASGADATVGLYMPPGGVYVGGGAYAEGEWGWSNEFRFKYTSGPLKGLQIQFNHVGGTRGGPAGGARLGRFPGDVNSAGSVRIGNIAGIGGDSPGYRHSHLQFEMGGKRVDPRTIFCKEFGY